MHSSLPTQWEDGPQRLSLCFILRLFNPSFSFQEDRSENLFPDHLSLRCATRRDFPWDAPKSLWVLLKRPVSRWSKVGLILVHVPPVGLGRQRAARLTAATLLFSVQSVTRKFALAKHCEMDSYKFIKAKLLCSKKERKGESKDSERFPTSSIYYYFFPHIIAKRWRSFTKESSYSLNES